MAVLHLVHRSYAGSRSLVPGLLLCLGITGTAMALEQVERMVWGRAWLESLVLAILLGALVRTVWTPQRRWFPGIAFSAKVLLEIAVVLLGASVSAAMIAAAGWGLMAGIAATVVLAIGTSYAIGRMLRLPPRMALLVACGNSICGNSAIAAVAPVIGADGDDVAASIGFTAIFGVAVVLGLPVLGAALGLDGLQYGALAGLTVYAVPQVIAAAAPMGAVAVQMGALVKLVRVLMLGPVCVVMALIAPGLGGTPAQSEPYRVPVPARSHVRLHHLVPWFIVGFLALVGLRSFDAVPHDLLAPMGQLASFLTVVSMAALGLGVEVRTIARAGGRVTMAVVLSLLALGTISLGLIHLLHLA
ncbi:hypothetical protein Y88_3322 [Novosphingobium nitrogenifigens DSM 19370]|uniref:Sulfate exporter family transporter n=1 Tax=Novosphingobium nitrogenifigens DSM 19370 TaxID=983920 RepID=F1ZBT2_9SPHN|nr:YeiH family protein [Novosphingobium nitrogenifigens]EGD57992.1 hypothetical protein Y88_3322 [Novosphingobium nitrogenifigens DSM 19370]